MSKLIPPDVHEATVEKFRLRNRTNGAVEPDAGIDALSGAMRQARAAAEQIAALVEAVMADESLPVAARALKFRNTTIKLAERAVAGLDSARAKAQQELQSLEQAIAVPQPHDLLEAERHREIRARFLALPQQDRSDALSSAMAEGREPIVHALLADPFLVGMSTSEHNLHLAQWQAKRHPAETERRDRIAKALAAAERGGQTFLTFVEQQVTSPGQDMAEANRKRADELVAAATQE